MTVNCPGSKKVLSGGYFISSPDADDITVYGSWPTGIGEGWNVNAAEADDTSQNWSINAWAICA